MGLLTVLALLLAKVDSTSVAAFSGVALALVAVARAVTIDPRNQRLSERKENSDLRVELDRIYKDKREAEEREREALRRIDMQDRHIARLTGELDAANTRITGLELQVKHWREIASGS